VNHLNTFYWILNFLRILYTIQPGSCEARNTSTISGHLVDPNYWIRNWWKTHTSQRAVHGKSYWPYIDHLPRSWLFQWQLDFVLAQKLGWIEDVNICQNVWIVVCNPVAKVGWKFYLNVCSIQHNIVTNEKRRILLPNIEYPQRRLERILELNQKM